MFCARDRRDTVVPDQFPGPPTPERRVPGRPFIGLLITFGLGAAADFHSKVETSRFSGSPSFSRHSSITVLAMAASTRIFSRIAGKPNGHHHGHPLVDCPTTTPTPFFDCHLTITSCCWGSGAASLPVIFSSLYSFDLRDLSTRAPVNGYHHGRAWYLYARFELRNVYLTFSCLRT